MNKTSSLMHVQFLKVPCENCETVNFHPVFENKLVLNADEDRKCSGCGKVISRDKIVEKYSKLQGRE